MNTNTNDERRRNGEAADWGEKQAQKNMRRQSKANAPIDLEDGTRDGQPLSGNDLQIIEFHKRCVREGHDEMAEALENADGITEQRRLKSEFSRELADTQFGPKDDGIRRAGN